MATRPCKPDIDVKRLWRLLLPDAPMPNCLAQENKLAVVSKRPTRPDEPPAQEPAQAPARAKQPD